MSCRELQLTSGVFGPVQDGRCGDLPGAMQTLQCFAESLQAPPPTRGSHQYGGGRWDHILSMVPLQDSSNLQRLREQIHDLPKRPGGGTCEDLDPLPSFPEDSSGLLQGTSHDRLEGDLLVYVNSLRRGNRQRLSTLSTLDWLVDYPLQRHHVLLCEATCPGSQVVVKSREP